MNALALFYFGFWLENSHDCSSSALLAALFVLQLCIAYLIFRIFEKIKSFMFYAIIDR